MMMDEDELWWLQEDCKHLYKHIALANHHHHHHHNHKKKKKAIRVTRRARLLRLGINQAFGLCKRYPQHEIHCLEFGVYEGKDLARICNFLEYLMTQNNNVPPTTTRTRTKSQHKHDHSSSSTIVIHGFDSFEGLPEDWHNGQRCENNGRLIHEKGAFSMNGQVPEMDKVCQGLELKTKKKGQFNNKKKIPTVVFHKGWFHETVPQYLQQTSTSNTFPPRPPPPNVDDTSTTSSPPHAPLLLPPPPPRRRPMIVAFVHADADLYSSTRTFLNFLCQYKVLVKGSILVFDEYWNYPNWQQGEYMAWQEITQQYHIEYEYIGYHAPPLSSNNPLDDYYFDDDKKNKNNSNHKMNNNKNNNINNKRKKNTYGYQSVCIRVTRVQ